MSGCFVVLVLLALRIAPASADRILLKNGHALEGVIQEETTGYFRMSVPGGKLSVARASVAGIERASPEENKALEETWRQIPRPKALPAPPPAPAAPGPAAPIVLHPERIGNAYLIPVFLNGTNAARFVLDTGAGITVVSQAAADRAGATASVHTTSVGMADGTRYEAPVVRLRSLRIGTTEQRDVEAIVVPKLADPQSDGLLGMNVLAGFHLQLDPATGRLELKPAPAPPGERP